MDTIGYGCLGLATISILIRVAYALSGPVVDYDGTNRLRLRLADITDEGLSTLSSALFLALPLGILYVAFVLGRYLWTLTAG